MAKSARKYNVRLHFFCYLAASQIWELGKDQTNTMDFAEAIDNSDLESFGFTDDFIFGKDSFHQCFGILCSLYVFYLRMTYCFHRAVGCCDGRKVRAARVAFAENHRLRRTLLNTFLSYRRPYLLLHT